MKLRNDLRVRIVGKSNQRNRKTDKIIPGAQPKIIEKKERRSNALTRVEAAMKEINGSDDIGSRLALIQQLIPIGLMAVEEVLQAEVMELAGIRYHRDENSNKPWGSNIGSVHVGYQKHNIRVSRDAMKRAKKRCP